MINKINISYKKRLAALILSFYKTSFLFEEELHLFNIYNVKNNEDLIYNLYNYFINQYIFYESCFFNVFYKKLIDILKYDKPNYFNINLKFNYIND